ncbi:Linearmycin resistance ATP-binding protein LnrL [Alphaproteobacteria bacterium SO-S41]|nr:Linearmycin resistance ATP-binding protein LnrL [Alphaproteobacteria bacterium SO-S41]
MSTGESAISFREVGKSYGDFRAVEGLSFNVAPGSIYGFLGPNGAGKTTSLRMMLGMIAPSTGEISVLGSPSAMGVRERVGYLPEERGLYRRMTPLETIVYLARLKGMDAAPARKKALELLERFGLAAFAKSRIEALSKGMAQKVQILATIVHAPDLVILDEPFSGLDPVNQQVLEELVEDLRREGRTVLFSTHVMQHAERLCDRLLLIARGKLAFEGTLDEARDRMPQTIKLTTSADAADLAALPGVVKVAADPVHAGSYELTMKNGADGENLLRSCFERGLQLTGFDMSEPALHDIFVALVGEGAEVADSRGTAP